LRPAPRSWIVAAKLVATVDALSGGRLNLGVGVGHVAGEFEALGLEFRQRGAMTDEYLRVMRELWSSNCASFTGRWVSFHDLCPLTRPVQQPVPLLIGGDAPRSMRRALEFDAAWAPERPPTPHGGELRRPRLEPAEAREQITEIRELGIDEVIIDIPANKATYAANMEFAASLIGS